MRSERGQGVVEFAMVLPVLGALILIFIQFGKAINYWIDLTHVANEGARFATVGAPGTANFKGHVCSVLETGELRNGTGEIDAAKVTVTFPSAGARDVGDPVNVKVAAHITGFASGALAAGTFRAARRCGSSEIRPAMRR